MKRLILSIGLSVALLGCSDKEQSPAKPVAAAKTPAGDVAAGKAFAEKECKGCHGMDGKGIAPAIPNLAAQNEQYLAAALQAYKGRKRMHAALREKIGRAHV